MALTTELEFSNMIRDLAKQNRSSIMEAIIKYCDENFIEPDEIKSMIIGPLKDRLRREFEEVNMLKKAARFDV